MIFSSHKIDTLLQGWKRKTYSSRLQVVTKQAYPSLAPVIEIADMDRGDFGRRPLQANHNLHQSGLFSDAALIDLLDHFPRKNLYALTMGTDPCRSNENRYAINEGVSGTDLMQAVRNGRLWLNITRVDQADQRYRLLVDQLYAQLADKIPGFSPDFAQATLLISSPHALVYYHVDGPASVLWHIRGRKRIWIYPALDERYMEREALEDIFAGVRHEYVPYESCFDQAATIYDLEPGQWVTWPQNAPHRVTNLDSVNVSLSTEHFTAQTRARARVYVANRFFRTCLGFRGLSTKEQGPVCMMKTLIHYVMRKAGWDRLAMKSHTPLLRVDPNAPNGVTKLAGNNSAQACDSID